MEDAEIQPEEITEEQPETGLFDKIKIHKWKILTGVFGIFVFAGAVFGAYKLGQRQVQPAAQPTPTPEVVATPTPDPTANWKTYRSKDLNFELRYPSHYTPKEVISEANQGTVSFYVDDLCNQNYLNLYVNYNNQISIREKLVSSEPIEVNFIQTNLNINELPNNDHCLVIGKAEIGDCLRASVSFKSDGDDWQIGAIVRADNLDSDLDTFNLMLSTFRFLEEGMKDWKIYAGIKYGFEIKHPSDWVVRERTNEILFSEGGPTGDNIALRAPEKNIYGNDFDIEIYRIPDIPETSVMDYFKFAHRGDPGVIKSSQIVIIGPNNEEFIKIEESTGGHIGYIKITNKSYYEISYFNPGVQSLDTEIDRILSTFRFLE